MSTQNDQDFKELEPPRFENGKALLIAGLDERPVQKMGNAESGLRND
jgi:hypothetical protein